MSKWLNRMNKYKKIILPILEEEGVPPEIFYLAMIESGLNPKAYSYAHASGVWQFILSTAKIYGMKVIKSPKKNRGYQLKTGASNSRGNWLLFLHADSRLDEKWVINLIKIMRNLSSQNIAWYFKFKINESSGTP